MIPDDKVEAVTRGLHDAFGVTTFDDLTEVTGGHTASPVLRVVVHGSPYLLKIITRAEDPTRHYTNMRAAADAGLAPRVLYTQTDDKVSITDFVPARTFPVSDALTRLPALLRKLHALPPFAPAPFNTTCTFLLNKDAATDGFLQRFRAANVLTPPDTDEFFARHAQLTAIYPSGDAEMVSSHNDLFKPDNVLFDGERVWLVDWEASFLNDRYADLAVTANHVVTNDDEERTYLQAYFAAAPGEYQRARFHLMQQLSHLFYTMAFLYNAATPVDWTHPAPDLTAIHRRMWAKDFDLADKALKVLYGRAHWQRLQHNVRQPRYTDALEVVSARRGVA